MISDIHYRAYKLENSEKVHDTVPLPVRNCSSDGRNWPVSLGVSNLSLCLGVLCIRAVVLDATSEHSSVAYDDKNNNNLIMKIIS